MSEEKNKKIIDGIINKTPFPDNPLDPFTTIMKILAKARTGELSEEEKDRLEIASCLQNMALTEDIAFVRMIHNHMHFFKRSM